MSLLAPESDEGHHADGGGAAASPRRGVMRGGDASGTGEVLSAARHAFSGGPAGSSPASGSTGAPSGGDGRHTTAGISGGRGLARGDGAGATSGGERTVSGSAGAGAGAGAGGAGGPAGPPAQLYPKEFSLKGYQEWVRGNGAVVKKYEEVIRMASLILPARFHDAEMVSEGVYSAVNLLGMYHDHLLSSGADTDKASGPKPSPLVHGLQWALTVISNVQVVTEMIAYKRGGKTTKWNWILLVEVLRAALKLFVCQNTGGVLFNGGRVQPPTPPPHMVGETAPEGKGDDDVLSMLTGGGAAAEAGPPRRWWKGSRSGARLPLPAGFPESLASGSSDEQERRMLAAGEMLHILRPVVYVGLRRAFGGKSWLPVLGSLATDMLSWQCSKQGVSMFGGSVESAKAVAGGVILKALVWLGTAGAEGNPKVDAEMSRRKWLWGFYLLRSPVFELIIKSSADKAAYIASYIPLVGLLVTYLRDIMLYFQRHYFYVSGSS